MTNFLETVANHILNQNSEELAKTIIILPNRRSTLFLQKHLAKLTNKTIWLPQMISIEDFVFERSNFKKATSTDLIFELYETYLYFEEKSLTSFEDFGSFGPGLIKDFNDIDSYLADAKIVFTFLKEARALQKWNPDNEKTGKLEQNFLQFYSNLFQYYNHFKNKLLQQNLAYYGMAIRSIIDHNEVQNFSKNKYIIAGFNAISKAEAQLFEILTQEGQAITFIDADDYYLKNPIQEAGKHLNQLIKNEKLNKKIISGNEFETNKNIEIQGISGEIGMCNLAAQKIHNWLQENKFDAEATAIILPNEDLLFPLLSVLPKELDTINITMSYPLSKTNGYDLIIKSFELFESKLRHSEQKAYHHNAVKSLLNNTLIIKCFGNKMTQFFTEIQNQNISYIDFKTISEINTELEIFENENPLSLLNHSNFESLTLLNRILNLIENIEDKLVDELFELKILNESKKVIQRLQEKLQAYSINEKPGVLKKIFQSMADLQGISFEGKPLAGLQIMGLLETRNIDFEKIIYLSFNEEQIPKSTQFKSYILPEIRYHFGMPMPNEEDAIAAYHFYRSIQKSKDITLIYNILPGTLGGGELSRFGKQILTEMKNSKIKIEHKLFELPIPKNQVIEPISIKKNPEIIEKLKQIASESEYGFSPSALSIFLQCPLKYYFNYILHVKPMDDIEEEIGINIRGSAIHETLEHLYLEEIQEANQFDEKFFDESLTKHLSILNQAYSKHYKRGDIDHGYNLLLRKLDEKMIKAFLIKEKDYSKKIKDVKCEEKLIYHLPLNLGNEIIEVKLRGSADRIDKKDEILRIIDYKTGKMEQADLKINPAQENQEIWNKIFKEGKLPKTFQLLMYSYLYFRNNPETQQILPIIAALKTNQIYFELKPKSGFINQEIISEFETELKILIQRIFDKDENFYQTAEIKTCLNCDYKESCNR